MPMLTMINSRWFAVAAAAALVAGGVTYFVARSSSPAPLPIPPDSEALRAAGAQAIRTATLAPVGQTNAIAESIRSAATSPEIPAPDRDALAVTVATFLSLRFASDDPTAFMQWRAREGYHPRPLDELRRAWFIDQAHEAYLGAPAPPDATFDDLFHSLASAQRSFQRGSTMIAQVGTSPGSVAVALSRPTRANPAVPTLTGPLADVLNFGGPRAISQSWWRPPRTLNDMLAAGDTDIRTAIVAFVAEYADGTRRPCAVYLIRNPRDRRWYIDGFWHGNPERADTSSARLEY